MAFISRLGCFMLFAAFIVIGMNFAVIHTLRNSNSDNKFDELQKAKDEVTFWKDKASRTEEKYANNPNKHPVCQQLSYPTPSALSLWHLNINAILKATQLPKDSKFEFHDFTAELLQIISPRLPRSVKSIPHEWSSLERAMTVAWERYQYNSLSKTQLANIADSPPPRPLKILVMGGSLLVGQNCRQVKKELGIYMLLPLTECNWSNRLDEFLNAYFGAGMVEVTKVAMGGTNTATGNVIWDFDLIPENSKNPDVVVNAYSTNDMHVLTNMQAQSANTTLRDKVFEMTQEYVRSILKTCNPNQPPPLLLHVDDYLGNEQRKIWGTTELSQGVQVLANYYGFTSFSYADTVRDIVYGDTYESWFSSNWWENNIYQRQIHPGMGMHISSMWVVVYNLLNLVTTYCSMPTMPSSYSSTSTTYTEGFLGLPKLRKDVAQAKGKPKPPPQEDSPQC